MKSGPLERWAERVGRPITYRGREYRIERRPELALQRDRAPWCIEIAGGWYQISLAATDPDRAAADFLRTIGKPAVPSLTARRRYPLLLLVDGVAVRAWTQLAPRAGRYFHPYEKRWTQADRGPAWKFEIRGREPSFCGSATSEQSIEDVFDLATIWLRAP